MHVFAKKPLICLTLLFGLSVFSPLLQPVQAQEAPELPVFSDAVAFEYTLDRLASEVTSGEVSDIPKNRYMILDGIVSSRQLINPQEGEYFAILELSSGEWVGGEDLAMYRCYVQLIGPSFAGTVPEPRSREKGPEEISLHSHLLLIGRYLGYGEDQQGNRFPVLEAVDLRILQQ